MNVALDAKQKAALLAFKQAVKVEGLQEICNRTGLHRQTVQAVISDTAREGSVLLCLDRFAKGQQTKDGVSAADLRDKFRK
jgi:hypothetical protein